MFTFLNTISMQIINLKKNVQEKIQFINAHQIRDSRLSYF